MKQKIETSCIIDIIPRLFRALNLRKSSGIVVGFFVAYKLFNFPINVEFVMKDKQQE